MSLLKSDPRVLNLLFSTVLLLVGLIVYWLWHPRRFHEHPFIERAFEFWVLKWLLFVVTYGLLTTATDLRFVLAAIDLNSTVSIGFVIALWKGDSYDERHTLINLLFLFGLLFSWNFVSFPIIPGKWWIMPSMTVALLGLLAMGLVILARFGAIASSFFLVSIAYILMQMPTYQLLFLHQKSDQELVKWLAFAKLLYGGMFYPIFFSSISNFNPIQIPQWTGLGQRSAKALNWALAAIGGGVLTEAALWLGKMAWRKITGSPFPS